MASRGHPSRLSLRDLIGTFPPEGPTWVVIGVEPEGPVPSEVGGFEDYQAQSEVGRIGGRSLARVGVGESEKSATESPEVQEISSLLHLRERELRTQVPWKLRSGSEGESWVGKHDLGCQDQLRFPSG
jgi:hypothetical protein